MKRKKRKGKGKKNCKDIQTPRSVNVAKFI